MADLTETRKGVVVAAARSLREDRVAGGIALLVSAGYGLMLSKAGLEADGSIEATVMDLVGEQREVGTGVGKHVNGALLKALGPLLEQAGKRPRLKGITGGKGIKAPVDLPENAGKHEAPSVCCAPHATGDLLPFEPCAVDLPHSEVT